MKKMFFSRMTIVMMVAVQFLASCSKDDNNEQPKHGEVINQEAAVHGYMVLKREDDTSLNSVWDCSISCEKEDEPNVWVDLNNNGKKDENEAITSFTYYEFEDNYEVNFPVSSGVIVVYGKVTKLYCAANKLTALEVSENTSLEELICNENSLTELDVTKNVSLKVLICADNKLTELDVTKNTKLFALDCSNNELDGLDVTKNTDLHVLNCSSSLVKVLDVTKNIKLESLDCSRNPLNALDVTKNTNLEELYCYRNSFGELDITKNTKLRNLWCYENLFDKTNMEKIIAALPNYTTGEKPRFYGWAEKDNNYRSVELRNQVVGKGWMPYHSVGGTFKVWN